MQNFLLATTLFVFLILSIVFGVYIWLDLGEVEISIHGWIALAAGVILSLFVGCGLMALVFFSARRGHDEASFNQSAFKETAPDKEP
ncbi:hypothetical protein ACTL6U_02100 [Rhodovibrionaceae bacterium A322]